MSPRYLKVSACSLLEAKAADQMHEAPQLDFQPAQQFTCAPQATRTAIYMAPCTPTGTFRLIFAHRDSQTG